MPGAAFLKPGLGNTNQGWVSSEASFAPRLTGGYVGELLAKTLSIDRSFGWAPSVQFLHASHRPTLFAVFALGPVPRLIYCKSLITSFFPCCDRELSAVAALAVLEPPVGADVEQRLQGGSVASLCGRHQGGLAEVVGLIDLGTGLNQRLKGGSVAPLCGQHQGGLAVGVDLTAGTSSGSASAGRQCGLSVRPDIRAVLPRASASSILAPA